jgi:regulation of enolase protein 1 (concanavalin A-like superfamily)
MRRHFRALALLFVGAAVVTGWNNNPQVTAQASTRPSVTIAARIPSLAVQVFPADFNKDGKTDLVGASGGGYGWAGALEVRYGNGNGTFGDPIRPAVPPMVPLGVGDFNSDTRTDILAYQVQQPSGAAAVENIVIVPGTAAGFATPVVIDAPMMPGDYLVAATADFDRDGARDFVLAGRDDNLYFFPGHGDLTFDPPRTMPNSWLARGAVAADLNGDSRPDLALTTDYGRSLEIYLNQGAFTFAQTTVPLDGSGLGVTAWDIDGDGDRDLLAGSGDFNNSASVWNDGFLNVLTNSGAGVFAPPIRIPTLPGPVGVVAGDFNRDGIVDVATANQIIPYNAACDGWGYIWSSVSIMPGIGNGTFEAAASFSLGFDQQADDAYRWVNGLRTSDVNGDGHTDLITSAAAILLNAPATANRPPVADAGPDVQNVPSFDVFFRGSATDPDGDLLAYKWTDESGRIVGRDPYTCLGESYATREQTFTLTVSDGRGGVSSDRMTVTFDGAEDEPRAWIARPEAFERVQAGAPYTLRFGTWSNVTTIERLDLDFSPDGGDTWTPIPECTALPGDLTWCTWRNPATLTDRGVIRVRAVDANGRQAIATSGFFSIVTDATGAGGLPTGWASTDVGPVATAGSATYSNGTFTVKGSGADIWGSQDEFHYVWQAGYDDFAVTARVVSVQNVNQWTKAGLMIRSTAWSGGAGAVHASVFATPTTVKGLAFQRRRDEGGLSTNTAGPAMTAPIWLKLTRIGYRVTSYYRKNLSDPWTPIGAETFSYLSPQVAVGLAVASHVDGQLATAVFDNVSIEPLPAFTSLDIGSVGLAGATRGGGDSVNLAIDGSGADIWNSADAFRYHYARWFGDGTITVRVRSLENTHAWAKAGVMFRESTAPGSKHVMAIVSSGKGLALQYRSESGQSGAQAAIRAGTAPEWIRLSRSGNTFTAATSDDGVTWQTLGSVAVAMNADIVVGLAVTSHDNTQLATATFEEVRMRP